MNLLKDQTKNESFILKWNYCTNKVYNSGIPFINLNDCVINLIFGLVSFMTVVLLSFLIYVLVKKNKIKNKSVCCDIRLNILLLVFVLSMSLCIIYLFEIERGAISTIIFLSNDIINSIA